MKPDREQITLTKGVFAAALRVLKSHALQLPAEHVQQLLNEMDRAVVAPLPEEERSAD